MCSAACKCKCKCACLLLFICEDFCLPVLYFLPWFENMFDENICTTEPSTKTYLTMSGYTTLLLWYAILHGTRTHAHAHHHNKNNPNLTDITALRSLTLIKSPSTCARYRQEQYRQRVSETDRQTERERERQMDRHTLPATRKRKGERGVATM